MWAETHWKKSVNEEYANITRGQITNYIDLCEICYLKRNKPKKGIVTNPIISKPQRMPNPQTLTQVLASPNDLINTPSSDL